MPKYANIARTPEKLAYCSAHEWLDVEFVLLSFIVSFLGVFVKEKRLLEIGDSFSAAGPHDAKLRKKDEAINLLDEAR